MHFSGMSFGVGQRTEPVSWQRDGVTGEQRSHQAFCEDLQKWKSRGQDKKHADEKYGKIGQRVREENR